LTFVDQSTPAPIAPKNANFIETDESKKAPEPKEKTFESNANSIGASEITPTGDMPVPSQQGKDRPFMNLETRQYSLPSQGAQAQPSVAPMETPQPSQTPVATPEPDQLALLRQTPKPLPTVESTPTTQQQPNSAYRSQQQKTLIRGSISNRGISSVNALGTPLGRYQKSVIDEIGSRWYASVGHIDQGDLFGVGTARLTFSVDRSGRVTNLKVVEKSCNEAFANICIRCVQAVKLQAMSDDIADSLPPGGLEFDLPFIIFPN